MKKHRLFSCIVFILCIVLLSGCTSGVTLTDEQSDQIAQYLAGVLYKHTYSFQNKYPDYGLVYEEETTTEEETPYVNPSEIQTDEPSTEPTTEDGSSSLETKTEEETTKDTSPVKPGTPYDIAEALDLSGLKLTYESYAIVTEYPDDPDAWFTFSPQEGYKFLIINFKLGNPTGAPIIVNTADQKPVFRITFEDETFTSNYTNLMNNDLSNLKDVTVEAGQRADCILIFMIQDEYASDLGTVTISYADISFEIR